MRFLFAFIAGAAWVLAAPAFAAETWQQYTYPEAGFSAHFPDRPSFIERVHQTSQAPGGAVTERVYSFNEGGVVYSVGILDFTRLDADPDIAVAEVVSGLTDLGALALETSSYIDQMHGTEFVVRAADGTSYTDSIYYVKEQLYQVKVIYPANNSDPAGSSGIIQFEAKFRFLDPY